MNLLKDEALDFLDGPNMGRLTIEIQLAKAKTELQNIEIEMATSNFVSKEMQIRKDEIEGRIKALKKKKERAESAEKNHGLEEEEEIEL